MNWCCSRKSEIMVSLNVFWDSIDDVASWVSSFGEGSLVGRGKKYANIVKIRVIRAIKSLVFIRIRLRPMGITKLSEMSKVLIIGESEVI